MSKIPNFADHMTKEEFIASVKGGLFIDTDGFGFLATLTDESDIEMCPSQVENWPDEYTHICWYNK